MYPTHSGSIRFALVLAVLGAAASVAIPTALSAIAIEARLVVPPGSETELKSALSTAVQALPAPVNQPLPKGTLLIEMDLRKVQKEFDALTKDLARAQAERRRLANERGATSSTPASTNRVDMGNAQAVADAQFAEATAMSDLTRAQTELATANLRAPADGYVVRQLYAVGAKAKRRKPILVFVEAQKTAVEVAVPAAEAGPFAVGRAVRIADAGNPSRGFRGRVLSLDPAGDSVAIRIQPLELPYLAVEVPAPATLSLLP